MSGTFPTDRQPFPQTSWSLIESCRDAARPGLRERLDVLFGKYWSPVYSHIVRHWTRDESEARDLTQAFFVAFLERDFLRSVEAGRGRFRTFVLTALKHFLLNQRRDAAAGKRRPKGAAVFSLEALRDENARFDVPDSSEPADAQFDLDWKKAVVRAALARLRSTARAAGRESLVDYFVELDLEASVPKRSYQEFADAAGLPLSQVKNGLRRVRREFLEAARAEVSDLVLGEEDLETELRDLFGIVPGPR